MSSKPFFKKSLKKLVKAFSKEVVEKTGRHLFPIGNFNLNFQGFAGILSKIAKWVVVLVFIVLYLGFCTRK